MTETFAAAITKAASRQTYYTIRYLVDRPLVDDAYRAYAYFRWLDDVLDAPSSVTGPNDAQRAASLRFVRRQRALLDACLRGTPPSDVSRCEEMLVRLTLGSDRRDGGLELYLADMMRVMEFDAGRRGRLISAAELDSYTRWLASAVTEAVSFFIGNGTQTPHDQTRYRAASGAHILHMLRDTREDVAAGYYNIPREVLERSGIGPDEISGEAYRSWVRGRVRQAEADLDAGRDYLARVRCRRQRLACLAYIGRFAWLVPELERNGFQVAGDLPVTLGGGSSLRAIWDAISVCSLRSRRPYASGTASERLS